MSYYEWRPYVPVAERRRKAARKLAKLKKKGQSVAPVTIEGRTIATTFWGKSWCTNLERYSDFASRLPRGRTYVRNGSVVDLQIAKGEVAAMVSGSTLYKVTIDIAPVAARALEGDLPRLRRLHRFAGGAAAGPAGQGRHGSGLPGGRRPVSRAEGDQAVVQLPGLGRHVQARRGGALRRRRAARRAAAAAVRAARRRRERIACRRRAGFAAGERRARTAKVLDDGDVAALFGLEMAEPAKADAVVAASPAKVTATSNRRKARVKTDTASRSKNAAARKPNVLEATPSKSRRTPASPTAKSTRAGSATPSPPGRDRRHARRRPDGDAIGPATPSAPPVQR